MNGLEDNWVGGWGEMDSVVENEWKKWWLKKKRRGEDGGWKRGE